ncbi:MAG: hotdog fold thioesterase [Crenarchaeota archaeon]|nr:hotdog fold thioesterase [Thermoproteota archaeon]
MKGTDQFAKLLGITLLDVKDGYAKVTMQLTKDHMNALNMTNGGVIFSFADYAFAEASNFGDNIAVAVQANINFIRPTFEGDILIAEATRISGGKTFGLYNISICKEDKLIATFSGMVYRKQ